MYDVGNEDSFASVAEWIAELDAAAPASAIRFIVGNK